MSKTTTFTTKPIEPFGVELFIDASQPLDAEAAAAFRELFYREKLVLIRGQHDLPEADLDRLTSYVGPVLDKEKEAREIAADAAFGDTPLAYHSDLSFTTAPYTALTLHAVELVEGESYTRFANNVLAVNRLSPELRTRVEQMKALAILSADQTQRAVPFSASDFFPQVERDAIMTHTETGEPILYVTEMHTAQIGSLTQPESEAVLEELFSVLYADDNVYEHVWREGDIVLWDNIALQHSRPDLSRCTARRLRRATVGTQNFYDLCPQFDHTDPRLMAWAAGDQDAFAELEREGA